MANPLYGQNSFDNAVDNSTGVVKHIKPASDGTHIAAAETVILASTDAGNKYFVDFGTNTASFRLPSAYANKGMEVHFYADINSDGETSKDLDIFTDSTAEFIIGALTDGGTVHDSDVDNDLLQFDSSGGTIGAGDRLSLVCDGIHWYITEATALTAGCWVAGTATRA